MCIPGKRLPAVKRAQAWRTWEVQVVAIGATGKLLEARLLPSYMLRPQYSATWDKARAKADTKKPRGSRGLHAWATKRQAAEDGDPVYGAVALRGVVVPFEAFDITECRRAPNGYLATEATVTRVYVKPGTCVTRDVDGSTHVNGLIRVNAAANQLDDAYASNKDVAAALRRHYPGVKVRAVPA